MNQFMNKNSLLDKLFFDHIEGVNRDLLREQQLVYLQQEGESRSMENWSIGQFVVLRHFRCWLNKCGSPSRNPPSKAWSG